MTSLPNPTTSASSAPVVPKNAPSVGVRGDLHRLDLLIPVAIVAVTWVAAGPGSALLVIGVVALTAAFMQLPLFSAPLSAVPVAIVVEGALVGSVGFLTALMPFRFDFAVTAGLALGGPVAVGVVGWALLRARRVPSPDRAGQVRFIGAVMGVFLGIALVLESWGRYYAVGWALSNDSANHLQIAASMIRHNGMTVHQIKSYPPIAELLVAVVSGLSGRAGLAPGPLVLHDAQALASVMFLAVCAIALLLAAGVWQVARTVGSRRSAATFVLMAAAAAAACTQAIAGIGIAGGFLSALVGMVFTAAGIIVTMLVLQTDSPAGMVLVFVAAAMALLTWVLLGLALAALVALTVVGYWTIDRVGDDGAPPRRGGLAVSILCGAGLIAMFGGVAVFHRPLFAALELPGGIAQVEPWLFVALVGTSMVGAVLTTGVTRWLFVVPAVFGIASAVLIGSLKVVLRNPGLSHYYEMKFIWIQSSALAWVPLAFVAVALAATGVRADYRRYVVVIGLLMSGAVMWGSWAATLPGTQKSLIAWVAQGGDFGDQAALSQLFAHSDGQVPVVFWGDRGGNVNSVYLNFISSQIVTAGSRDGRGRTVDSGFAFPVSPEARYFYAWSHSVYPRWWHGTQTGVLCHLLANELRVIVITSNADAPAQVAATCPDHAGRVVRYVPVVGEHAPPPRPR
jgi:hypothetical protein